MLATFNVILTSTLLAGAAAARDIPPPQMAVIVHYRVSEQSAERVEEIVLAPLMRTIANIPRVKRINGTATHGRSDVEIQFDGGATEADLAAVSAQIEQLALGGSAAVTSRAINRGLHVPHP